MTTQNNDSKNNNSAGMYLGAIDGLLVRDAGGYIHHMDALLDAHLRQQPAQRFVKSHVMK